MQLFERGESAKTAYIGGVFKSEMLRERFRLLVELEDGNDVIAPQYGPGVGALIEAYAGCGHSCGDLWIRLKLRSNPNPE